MFSGMKTCEPTYPGPTDKEVKIARRLSVWSVLGTHYSALDGPLQPYSGSCQKQEETQDEFVSWICREELEYSVMESEAEQFERQGRMHQTNIEQYDMGLKEPTIGTTIFKWVELPSGYFLRKQIPCLNWTSKWVLKPSYQKHYYSLIVEWDFDRLG
jgi:hypothetical protein